MTITRKLIIAIWICILAILTYGSMEQLLNKPITACDQECKRNSMYRINICKKIDPLDKTDCISRAIEESNLCEKECKGLVKL